MLEWIKSILPRGAKDTPLFLLTKITSYADYTKHLEKCKSDDLIDMSFEKSLLSGQRGDFFFESYCYVCRQPVGFLVDFKWSYEIDGVLMPNWRERLVCPGCHLNNRMRATVHIFEQEYHPNSDSKLYVTEQTTPLYNWFKNNFAHIYGSEFLGDSVAYGSCNDKEIRNEDVTRLSFPDENFDYILSFDVFEHIPGYAEAFKECFRCLKPDGVLYFSVPFVKTSEKNIVRACISSNGEVKHLLPPEYHGDPLRREGCLAFYHFGWEMLDELRAIGFEEVSALLYWSSDYGYLGGEQIIFTAKKP